MCSIKIGYISCAVLNKDGFMNNLSIIVSNIMQKQTTEICNNNTLLDNKMYGMSQAYLKSNWNGIIEVNLKW